MKVLLIEDNPDDASLAREMLRNVSAEKFEVTHANRLSEALEMLTADIDVVLLDLGLPDSNGVDTFNKIHTQAPHLPIIVLSGNTDEETALKTVKLGAQDYLVKNVLNSNMLGRVLRYAIERKQFEGKLTRSYKRLQMLNEMSQTVSQTLDLQELLNRSLAKILNIIEAETGFVYIFNTSNRCLEIQSQIVSSKDFLDEIRTLKLKETELDRIMKWPNPTLNLTEVLSEENTSTLSNFFEREGLRTLAAIPLRTKATLQGVIFVIAERPRSFNIQDMRLLYGIANQMAVAVDNALLYRETKDKADRLALITSLSRIICSSLDIRNIYSFFIEGIKRLINFDQAIIMFIANENVHFFAVYSTVPTEIIAGSTMPAYDTGMLWLLENKSVLVENDLSTEKKFSIDDIFLNNGMRSVIRLPLHSRGEIYGSFNLTSRTPYSFGKREQEALEELTAQIAVAIENSRLAARINNLMKEWDISNKHIGSSDIYLI